MLLPDGAPMRQRQDRRHTGRYRLAPMHALRLLRYWRCSPTPCPELTYSRIVVPGQKSAAHARAWMLHVTAHVPLSPSLPLLTEGGGGAGGRRRSQAVDRGRRE
eukprot:3626047-Rhodomonas_salina.1